MARVLSWQINADAKAAVEQAVQALSSGKLVAFPTETTYVVAASARVPDAVARLACRDADSRPLALGVGGLPHALDLVPDMGLMGRRLARRCWPGPLTLVCEEGLTSNVDIVPTSVRDRLCASGPPSLRTPAHSAILHVLYEIGDALVLTAPGATPPATPDLLLPHLSDDVTLLIDDGPCRFGPDTTVVRVGGDQWRLEREGIVGADQLQVQAACVVVFVCTGNTCRSPLAEALCKKRLADRLGCSQDELARRGFVVLSAGLAALEGDRAAEPAIEIGRERGVELSNHASQPLDRFLAVQADYLVCMTRSHLETLVSLFPHLGCYPRLLSADGTDLPDPIGQDAEVYRGCAARIEQDLEGLVEELLAAQPRQGERGREQP